MRYYLFSEWFTVSWSLIGLQLRASIRGFLIEILRSHFNPFNLRVISQHASPGLTLNVCTVPTKWICVFHIILSWTKPLFPTQYPLTCHSKGRPLDSGWCKNWIFAHSNNVIQYYFEQQDKRAKPRNLQTKPSFSGYLSVLERKLRHCLFPQYFGFSFSAFFH
jgi:hypothetical protein